MNRRQLADKVWKTGDALIKEKGYIAPVDLLLKMDRLTKRNYEAWRFGKVPYLEKVCTGNLSKLSFIMKELRKFAHERNLDPSWTYYKRWGKGKKTKLRFSKSGNKNIERAYATHHIHPRLKNKS